MQERYGLVWAFMGPPDRKPVLPRYDILEELGEGETLEADATSMGTGGPTILRCNWLQHWENVMDPFHVPILHGSFSGAQFVEQMALMPQVEWEYTDLGVRTISRRTLESGNVHHRVTEVMFPAIRVVPSPRVGAYQKVEKLGWVLPIDDHHMRIYTAGRVTGPGQMGNKALYDGKPWAQLTEAEHRQFPGDAEAQEGQGPITFHSDEHLVTSDKGIGMVRRALAREIGAVEQGRDPAGVVFDEAHALVHVAAGNFLHEYTTA